MGTFAGWVWGGYGEDVALCVHLRCPSSKIMYGCLMEWRSASLPAVLCAVVEASKSGSNDLAGLTVGFRCTGKGKWSANRRGKLKTRQKQTYQFDRHLVRRALRPGPRSVGLLLCVTVLHPLVLEGVEVLHGLCMGNIEYGDGDVKLKERRSPDRLSEIGSGEIQRTNTSPYSRCCEGNEPKEVVGMNRY